MDLFQKTSHVGCYQFDATYFPSLKVFIKIETNQKINKDSVFAITSNLLS